jgi:hypothetical protein
VLNSVIFRKKPNSRKYITELTLIRNTSIPKKRSLKTDQRVIDGKNELGGTTDILLSDVVIVGELGSGS